MAGILDPDALETSDWPQEVIDKYERFEILGKGSFGMVWMSRRISKPVDEFDDEFVAIKNIKIKDEKSQVYAEREIRILEELRHPFVIRLIRAFPEYGGIRVVVMQLARGPNLHQLVIKRGALGLPLARLVSRQLIAAVSYLHGRAVIHRDIKPSNCILACNNISPTVDYDWVVDHAIWSNNEDGQRAVKENKWKVMLVDFGFARALERKEITAQSRRLRNSIMFEKSITNAASVLAAAAAASAAHSTVNGTNADANDVEHSTASDDADVLDQLAEKAALNIRKSAFEPTNDTEAAIMGPDGDTKRKRLSGVSMALPQPSFADAAKKRQSTARHHVRSMSALGTKAYAAPEIRKKLRQKTDADFEKENAAMTECVADYGMIVDAYSVGWTLRVAITGVPPNFTISEYMRERTNIYLEGEEEEMVDSCCCFRREPVPGVRIRDPAMIPNEATLLITHMTEKNPENRMTVREAQNHAWILGDEGEERYEIPQGDVPSLHGDPVVPLNCAPELSELTVMYHMQ